MRTISIQLLYTIPLLRGDGGRPALSKERESFPSVVDMVFLGVARQKRHHPGKLTQKPHPLGVMVDLNLALDHSWVVEREIGSKWGADALRPNFLRTVAFESTPDLLGGQGVLDEPPCDVSNSMDQSDGDVELWGLSPN
ncbi:hypothetical protein DSO57_1002785 [Entomophthora muscae]|uniref:Uncharacterized protein n=1 Tax=Entomophthora muscae TaxID=34485 RepID=A0ACC2RNL8_9FUNG|nr:hypothetical protein DSO57_1002785 [Entomophthora muscae]